MLMALTREISPALESCQLTHLPRVPINVDRARAQHAAYEWALVEAGCTIRRLDAGPDMPDSVFIEDIAVVLDEGAVVCRPGAESRRVETAGVVDALVRHGRPMQQIQAPGTLDGGDVLVIGRQVFVGSSARTNRPAHRSALGHARCGRLHRSRRTGARLPALEVGGHSGRARHAVDQSRVRAGRRVSRVVAD